MSYYVLAVFAVKEELPIGFKPIECSGDKCLVHMAIYKEKPTEFDKQDLLRELLECEEFSLLGYTGKLTVTCFDKKTKNYFS